MDLDSILKKRMKSLSKSIKRSNRKRSRTPEQIHKQNIRYITKLVVTGDYDPTKRSHAILMHTAHKEGYINKHTLEILKEI